MRPKMSEAMDGYTVVFERNGLALTRLEVTTIAGSVLAIVSLFLPWVTGLMGTLSGLEYTWMAPGFVVAAAFTIVLAIPSAYRRVRAGLVALAGVLLASIGIIVLLGLPSLGAGTGVGLYVFVLAGLLVTIGGYATLVRETSTLKATAVVCVSSLLVLVVGLLAINAS